MRKPLLDSLPARPFWNHIESKRIHSFMNNFVSQYNSFILNVSRYYLIISLLLLKNIVKPFYYHHLDWRPS